MSTEKYDEEHRNFVKNSEESVKTTGETFVEKGKDAAVATGKGIASATGFVAEKIKDAAVATGKSVATAAGFLAEKTKEGIEIARDPHTKEAIVEKSKEAAETTKGIIQKIEETSEKAVDFIMGKTDDNGPTAQDYMNKASELLKEKTEEVNDALQDTDDETHPYDAENNKQ